MNNIYIKIPDDKEEFLKILKEIEERSNITWASKAKPTNTNYPDTTYKILFLDSSNNLQIFSTENNFLKNHLKYLEVKIQYFINVCAKLAPKEKKDKSLEQLAKKNKWKDSKGKIHNISEMETNHIKACIKAIENNRYGFATRRPFYLEPLKKELELREEKENWIEFSFRDNFYECTKENSDPCKQDCRCCEFANYDFSELKKASKIKLIEIHSDPVYYDSYDSFMEYYEDNGHEEIDELYYQKKEHNLGYGNVINANTLHNGATNFTAKYPDYKENKYSLKSYESSWPYTISLEDLRKAAGILKENKPIKINSFESFQEYFQKKIYSSTGISSELLNNNKGEKEMSNVTKKEEFASAEYTVCCPGANKENTKVQVDTNEKLIRIEFDKKVSCGDNIVTVSVPTRYDITKAKPSIVDGVMTIKVPVCDEVVTEVTIG